MAHCCISLLRRDCCPPNSHPFTKSSEEQIKSIKALQIYWWCTLGPSKVLLEIASNSRSNSQETRTLLWTSNLQHSIKTCNTVSSFPQLSQRTLYLLILYTQEASPRWPIHNLVIRTCYVLLLPQVAMLLKSLWILLQMPTIPFLVPLMLP